jgi:RNA polymerase sigma factor (sigma-70 family)
LEKIDVLYREHYSKMVSALVSYFGLSNFAVAEDIVQDTFVTAVEKWKVEGRPNDPSAWLFRVCKNKAINHLQKPGTPVFGDFINPVTRLENYMDPIENLFLDHEIKDSQLRLLFACCDPRLSPKSQVALILKNLCGLKVDEIASALLMSEEAVMKSLSRSKQTLSDGGILSVPDVNASAARLNIVHTAIYLMFSEGYSATEGEAVIKRELCIEAMRLIKVILEIHHLRNHDSFALMALMCFHSSRFDSRIGTEGELIELEDQDRNLWDKELIRLAINYLKNAHDTHETSRFIYEAAIASVHCIAEKFADTNWPVIVGLYDRLSEIQRTPFVDLNRAVAIFYSKGADEALTELRKSHHQSWLKNYYLYYALLGKIYSAIGNGLEAIRHYEKALSLTRLRAEQEFLKRKILSLQVMMN